MAEWGFLTNHLHALYCVARHPGIRIREVAESVGVQERAAHRLVADLVEGGYLTRRRVGSRNVYELHPNQPIRREGLDEIAVGEILDVLLGAEEKRSTIPAADVRPVDSREQRRAPPRRLAQLDATPKVLSQPPVPGTP
ncbi:helix-turn-helix transcriptional regulator [Arthrobacter sp. 2YAF22_2]|uniref:helix-turn-helix transcriptional regulator n=1 Tax=Arthrobacter sp. 2YAF22_2 TaxID=3233029 RepID=UPI003F93DA88